jgi:hypothetical protein
MNLAARMMGWRGERLEMHGECAILVIALFVKSWMKRNTRVRTV